MPVLPRRAGRLEALAWECSGEGFGLELAGGATGAGMGMSMGSGVALTIAERSNLALGGKVVAVNGDHATTTITVVPGLTSPPEGALARVALLKHHLEEGCSGTAVLRRRYGLVVASLACHPGTAIPRAGEGVILVPSLVPSDRDRRAAHRALAPEVVLGILRDAAGE